MNLIRRHAVIGILLLISIPVNAELIRFDVTGETVPQFERPPFTFTGGESDLLPYGTPFSAYVVYDPNTPPLYGSCEVTGEGFDYCNYNAVVEARFFLGPLQGEWEGPDPDEELTDFVNGDIDEIRWSFETVVSDVLENGNASDIDGVQILQANIIFYDTTGTALNDVELPTSWDLQDFDLSYGLLRLLDHDDVVVTIDSLTFNRLPEPGTLALLGIGLFGISLARRSKMAD